MAGWRSAALFACVWGWIRQAVAAVVCFFRLSAAPRVPWKQNTPAPLRSSLACFSACAPTPFSPYPSLSCCPPPRTPPSPPPKQAGQRRTLRASCLQTASTWAATSTATPRAHATRSLRCGQHQCRPPTWASPQPQVRCCQSTRWGMHLFYVGFRVEIFALWPAPVQTSYMGFLATTGASAVEGFRA